MTDWNPNDPDATRVYYDLSGWSFDHQAELAAAMADVDIPHTWEGAELVVPEECEAAADDLIAELEVRLGIDQGDAPVGGPAPEPVPLVDGVPTTEYDLGEWAEGERGSLRTALAEAAVPQRWEGDVLLVATADEAVVDELLDEIERGEYVDTTSAAAGQSGEQADAEVLTTFFLAGERLRRDPLDPDGLEQLLAANEVADPEAPPFGVQPRLWQQTCALAEQLTDALVGDDEPDHATAMDMAGSLHDLLRPHV